MEDILQALFLWTICFHVEGIAMDQVLDKGKGKEACDKKQDTRSRGKDTVIDGVTEEDRSQTIEYGEWPGNVGMGQFLENRVLKHPVLGGGVIICHSLSDL